jgi:hypothetical protein
VTLAGPRPAVRPTDGSTPPPVYHGVVPPAGATGAAATPATGGHVTVPVTAAGSGATGVATTDGQVAVSLGAGAVATTPGTRALTVRITPVRTKGLHPLPNGLRFNGNAYRISATLSPGGQAVTEFARPGSMTMELPEIGRALYRSTGSGWTEIASTPVPPRELAVSATLARPGLYVSGTDLPPPDAGTTGSKPTDDGVPVGAVVALVALVILVGLVVATATRMHARRRLSASAGSPDPDPGSPDHPNGS